jgi:hypothetical protein
MRDQPLIGRCHWQAAPRIVKGRKDYECCECGVKLPKGTRHEYTQGIWGNLNLEFRTCLECVDRWKALVVKYYGFDFAPFLYGDLNEAIAYLEYKSALDELDRDRLAKAIKEYEPFAYGEMLEEVAIAKEKVLRLDALQELVTITEEMGLYESAGVSR